MKRSYISYIILLFMALAIPTACSDDDEDAGTLFDGSDAFITSFQLEKEGNIYEGIISGITITVSAPTAVSFASGVTAAITVSENATLSPDPSAITNWEHNEQFIVRAYDGTTTTYTYSVQREVNKETGTIRLETQQDVEQFIAKEIQILEGTLIIGKEVLEEDEAGITDISGLAILQQITYDLVINPGYTGNDLTALNNLQWAGSITINDLPGVKEIEWANLQTVVYDFSVSGNELESVSFPVLASVSGMLALNTGSLVKAGFNYLQQAGGILLPGGMDHPLETISFPFLKTAQGDITIQNYPVLTTLDFPVLASTEDIQIGGLPILEVLTFPALHTIGIFTYVFCNRLQDIRFPVLESAVSLVFDNTTNNPSTLLEKLDVPLLKNIHTDCKIKTCNFPGLKDLYFPSLEEVGGHLYIYTATGSDNKNVETIRFPALKRIKETLSIDASWTAFSGGNVSLTTLDFSSLVSVQNISITNQKALYSFATFENLFKNTLLPEFIWNAGGCGYPVTFEQMQDGEYSQE